MSTRGVSAGYIPNISGSSGYTCIRSVSAGYEPDTLPAPYPADTSRICRTADRFERSFVSSALVIMAFCATGGRPRLLGPRVRRARSSRVCRLGHTRSAHAERFHPWDPRISPPVPHAHRRAQAGLRARDQSVRRCETSSSPGRWHNQVSAFFFAAHRRSPL